MALKESKLLRKRMSTAQRLLIIGVITAITSQLYFAVWTNGFRISAAAILYPILLMALMRNSKVPNTGVFCCLVVMTFRMTLDIIGGASFSASFLSEYPGALFYFSYDALLCLMIQDRHSASYPLLTFTFCVCDLISNAINLLLTGNNPDVLNGVTLLTLLCLAIGRSAAAVLILWAAHFYHQLLQRQEHEQRYQRLFLMTAELKTELYFLKKDSEDIEGVMARAYRLYERLGELGVPEEDQALALSIAREVHEIKKDNLRIIRGIEGEVADVYDQEEMRISDLFHILQDSTRRMLGDQYMDIYLDCYYEDNISVIEHYRLLSVLKNLVTNAVEALQNDSGRGTVSVKEYIKKGFLYLQISDNGPGISKRAMSNLFKVGYSTKFNPTTGNISRGVGLPAVKFIVDELNGHIKVDSTPGKGACFTVILPLATVQGEQI